MWFLIFVGAYVFASAGGETLVFRKCCSRNQTLIKVSGDESEERFECWDRERVQTSYNVSYTPLFVGDGVTVESSIPECQGIRVLPLSSIELNIGLLDSTEQCYDKLVLEIVNGTAKPNIPKLVTLTCALNETKNLSDTINLSIVHIRKCCPRGQSYDPAYHLCKKSKMESTEEWLVGKLNESSEFIYEVETGLHCKANEYGVELSEDMYSLEVERGSLRVAKKDGVGGGLVPQGEWCVDREFGRRGLVARVCTQNCSTYGAYCVRKCCPVGEHFRTRHCGSPISKCVPNDEEILFDIDAYINPIKEYGVADVLAIRADLKCPHGKVMLNISDEEQDYHYLTKEGYMFSSVATNNDYCLETFDSRHCPAGGLEVTAIICFIKPPEQKDFRISFVLITISSVCLALTLIVYCALPELRNLHGRTLICHVSMMLLAFSCLARVQYDAVPDRKICTALGYGIYFGFMAAFAWLNVMCLDIWWTFGSMRTVHPMRKAGSERRRFLWYSLYAWSITIFFTLTMFLLDRYPVARFLDANIGTGMCWFGAYQNTSTDWPHYIYFVIPMGLGTCTNFVLFMLTARHCARVKSEVHRMQAGSVGERAKKRFRVDRANYMLTGKLWVVMGAGWISELVATLATQPEWLWSVVDLINELQGVFIFLILIFKPKLYYLIRKRLGLEKPDPQKQGASSGRTSSTILSRTISTDERATLRISQGNNVKMS